MTSVPIRRTWRAEEDLISIWLSIAPDNRAAADRLLDRFDMRWELLASQPFSGMARNDLGEGIRRLVVGNYLTFYRVTSTGIDILRVLHGRRDITADDFAE
jgi:toxin ParE1/3/4